MYLDFTPAIEPDEFGIMDGRELARALIAHAYSLLTPYAEGSEICTDMLLLSITEETVAYLHDEARREGGLPCVVISTHAPGPHRRLFHMGHLEASRHETRRLLEKQADRLRPFLADQFDWDDDDNDAA